MGLTLLLVACAGTPDKSAPERRDDSSVTTDSAPDDSGSVDDTSVDDTSVDDTGDTDSAAPDPADLDGDGYTSPEYGGDDCDDHDAFTHPGAEEWCDGTCQHE